MSLSKSDIATVAEVVRAVLAEDSADSGVQVVAEAPKPQKSRRKGSSGRNSGPKTSAARKPRKSQAVKGCLTAGEAWTLLGADPDYEPKDHSRPATGPQLWNLNASGKLTLR